QSQAGSWRISSVVSGGCCHRFAKAGARFPELQGGARGGISSPRPEIRPLAPVRFQPARRHAVERGMTYARRFFPIRIAQLGLVLIPVCQPGPLAAQADEPQEGATTTAAGAA